MDLCWAPACCVIVLITVGMPVHITEGSSVVEQPRATVTIDPVDAPIVVGDEIHLVCKSSEIGTDLRYMHWYTGTSGGIRIYTYDYNMSLGQGIGEHEDRTTIVVEGIDREHITMTISGAGVADGGTYNCSINPILADEVFSNNIEVTIIPDGGGGIDTTVHGVDTTLGEIGTTASGRGSGSGGKGLFMVTMTMTIFLVGIAVT